MSTSLKNNARTCAPSIAANAKPAAPGQADRPACLAPSLSPLLAMHARKAREACGADMSQEALAELIGRRRQTVQQHESPSDPASLPNLADIFAAPRAYRRYLAKEIAAIDHDVVLPTTADAHNHGHRLHVIAQAAAVTVTSYTSALADNHVSEAERAEIANALRKLLDIGSAALVAMASGER